MAKDEDGNATMFLADMDQPGIEIVRTMHSMDQAFAGGHAVVRFNDLRVPASDILGEPGKGFRYAQVRLAPARLTHCMRWLGAARRAHDIAAEYAPGAKYSAPSWSTMKASASCWPTTRSTSA